MLDTNEFEKRSLSLSLHSNKLLILRVVAKIIIIKKKPMLSIFFSRSGKKILRKLSQVGR